MSDSRESGGAGHDELIRRLRQERSQASGLELDRIKQRARAQAARSHAPASRQQGGLFVKSRIVTLALVLGLMTAGTTAGVLAGGTDDLLGVANNAANDQYKPGCGPKKDDGVNPSGTHTGQPGKDPNRGDCPH
jgi:hypothetical protein